MNPTKLFALRLGPLLLAACLLPLCALPASALGLGPTDSVVEDLRGFLAAPGRDSLRITEDTTVVDYTGSTLVVNGHKTIYVDPANHFTFMCSLEIPKGASLTLLGSGRPEEQKGINASSHGEDAGITVRGDLMLNGIRLSLTTVMDGQVGLDIDGGSLTAHNAIIAPVAMSRSTGIQNAGTFSMTGGSLLIAGDNHALPYQAIGFHNAGGRASFEDTHIGVTTGGVSVGIRNGDEGGRDATMTVTGGGITLQNTDGTGILNWGGLHFEGTSVKFAGQMGHRIHNRGELAFENCGLGFHFTGGMPTHLYNDTGGVLSIGNSGVVTYGEGGTCIDNPSGEVHDGGGNGLVNLSRAALVRTYGGADIHWNEDFYHAPFTVTDAATGEPVEVSRIRSAWPGSGFTVYNDRMEPTYMWVFCAGGETLTLQAEGYKTARFTAPGAAEGAGPLTVELEPGRDVGPGPLLAAATVVLGIAAIFYQQKRGRTFVRPGHAKVE